MSLVVNQQGRVTDVEIVTPTGCGLDEQAVKGEQTWKFKPPMKEGRPV